MTNRTYKKVAELHIPPEKTCAVCKKTFDLWPDGQPLPADDLPFGVVVRRHYYKRLADGTLRVYEGGPQLRSRCNECHRLAERERAQRKRERAAGEAVGQEAS